MYNNYIFDLSTVLLLILDRVSAPTYSDILNDGWLHSLIYLLSMHAEELRNVRGRGTVRGGACTVGIDKRDSAVTGVIVASWAWPTTSHTQRWSHRDVGRDLDLERKLGTDSVHCYEIHSLLSSDICGWINLCQAREIGDLKSDKYVRPILTDNLIVCVCECVCVLVTCQYSTNVSSDLTWNSTTTIAS